MTVLIDLGAAIGIISVPKANAFRGAGARIFESERAAVDDQAVNTLAKRYLTMANVDDGHGTYNNFLERCELDPELVDATLKLIAWRKARI